MKRDPEKLYPSRVLHPSPYGRGKIRRIYWKKTTGTLIYLTSYEGGSGVLWFLHIPGEEWEGGPFGEPDAYHHKWKALAYRLDHAPYLKTIYADGARFLEE